MTWGVLLSIIVVSALKILITSMPTPVVKWLLGKFELHSKLAPSTVSITREGRVLQGEEKKQFINEFNKATFLNKYYVHSGNKNYFLSPDSTENPYIIDMKKGKHSVRLVLYFYKNQIDVVKLYKKKVEAYSLLSEHFQGRAKTVKTQ
ncbi:YfmQ family protein [Priestia aryabhattai]|uniref:YfmQ family protein n=1 Tax=Priestia aryabhattai TaxID=412384 RepID=UPI003982464C